VSGAELRSLDEATGWLNSDPLRAEDLRGRVVLVDFWTYTCINWLRSLPYVRAWADRYRDRGLVVIGVHTPEFAFERDLDNVRAAVRDEQVGYPVATDNEYAIWGAFRNRYWPAIYLLDADGRIRHRQFGEGAYEESEAAVRRLLGAGTNGSGGTEDAPVPVEARGAEAPADWADLRSPESYLGYERSESFASPGGLAADQTRDYTVPDRLGLNDWALSGPWTAGIQATVTAAAGGRIATRFHARDLHLVMGPADRDRPVRFRVRLDGQPPGEAHGLDVEADGTGTATRQRMYQLIRQPKPIGDRLFEIEFLDPGAAAYVLTFG
jgi:thiol-disulfide isomerase/thioredoxin